MIDNNNELWSIEINDKSTICPINLSRLYHKHKKFA
jgi:hypothetical protein